jgi:hypothetical protein
VCLTGDRSASGALNTTSADSDRKQQENNSLAFHFGAETANIHAMQRSSKRMIVCSFRINTENEAISGAKWRH